MGRFINSDRQINEGIIGKNLFAYCSNNPVNLYDPEGTWALCLPFVFPIGAVIAAAVIAVAIPVIAAAVTAAAIIVMFENSLISCGDEDYVDYTHIETVFEDVIEDAGNPALPEDVGADLIDESGSDTWGDESTLDDHYERHGNDVNATDAEDYADKANDLYNDRTIHQVKVGKNGVIRVYDEKNNLFGSYNKNGTTRTLFSPRNGQAYFDKQPGISIFE